MTVVALSKLVLRSSRPAELGGLAWVAVVGVALAGCRDPQRDRGRPAAAAATAPAAVPSMPPPSSTQIADARALSQTFSQVAAQLSPSVVRIGVTKALRSPHGRGGRSANPFEGTPFERFFNDQRGPEEDSEEDKAPGRGPKEQGTGSGVVIDDKGFILTNNHVVDGADEVKVTFGDGKTVPGKVVGTDPKTDLAVVKVTGVNVRAARLGDSDELQVGEWVIAIGNPFGLDHTVTVGVLSAKNRAGFQAGNYEDFLQTDASINPGNSGGPLVSLGGEVIGINTMIAGIGTGIGFAVPSTMARPIVRQLIETGRVRRPYLGIVMQDVSPELHRSLGGKAPERGALVSKVEPGSPAERVGMQPGDVITQIDDVAVDGSHAVQRTVLSHGIGQTLAVTVWRDGQVVQLKPTTAELPSEGGRASSNRGGESSSVSGPMKLGLALQTLTPALAMRLGLERGARGAIIAGIRPGGIADEAGLEEGDVLVEIDRKAVATAEEAAALLSKRRPDGHLARIRRGPAMIYLALPDKN
jgi:serine protease Do